jgi:hypothetical protein
MKIDGWDQKIYAILSHELLIQTYEMNGIVFSVLHILKRVWCFKYFLD